MDGGARDYGDALGEGDNLNQKYPPQVDFVGGEFFLVYFCGLLNLYQKYRPIISTVTYKSYPLAIR